MGFKTVQKVLRIDGISSTQKHVLTILALHADDETGECFPSITMLQEETNLSKPAVLRAVSALQEAGFLTVEKKWKKNFYRLVFSPETEYFDKNSQVTESYRNGNAGLPDKRNSQVTESYHSGNGELPHQVNESYLTGNGALPDKRIVNRKVKKNNQGIVRECAREAHAADQSIQVFSENKKSEKQESEKPKVKRNTRLSADWFLPKEWGDWALSEGFTESEIREQAEQFRDYWLSTGATKADWLATWRNWMRRSKQFVRAGPPKQSKTPWADYFNRKKAEQRLRNEKEIIDVNEIDSTELRREGVPHHADVLRPPF